MTVSAKWYGQAIKKAFNKEIDWEADAIKVQLHTSSYSPDQDTHAYQSDLSNEVSAGGGYATGGTALAGGTVIYTGASNVIKFDGSDVVWPASTITARYAVLVDTTPGSAAANPLLGYVDFGANMSSSAGNFTIAWSSDGIFTVTPA